MSKWNHSTDRRYAGCAGLGAVLLAALCSGLQAGNVFMKNGYIIQGPIVERSEAGIVLGWPNGKVTIHHRFIESVTYEANEEKQIQEMEQLASQELLPEDAMGSILGASDPPDELPADADKIVRTYVIDTSRKTSPAGGEDGSAGPADAGPSGTPAEPQTDVNQVARPDDLLGDRIADEPLGFAIRPPKQWTVSRNAGGIVVAPEAAPDVFRPSISVFRLVKGSVAGADYAAIVKEDNVRHMTEYELLSEGPRTLGGASAFEFLGRGTRFNRAAVVRQVLVEGADSLWLVTACVAPEGAEAVSATIEESLKTFELLGK